MRASDIGIRVAAEGVGAGERAGLEGVDERGGPSVAESSRARSEVSWRGWISRHSSRGFPSGGQVGLLPIDPRILDPSPQSRLAASLTSSAAKDGDEETL